MDYYIFDYSLWELAPTLYPNFSKGHFTLQEESFYHGYLLCFTLLPKRTRGPTLGFILHSQKKYSSFLGHCLGLVYAFFPLRAFGIWPNFYFFAHAPTHLSGSSWAFLLIGLLDMNCKNYQQ